MKKLHLLLFVSALSCFVMGCRKPVEVSFGVETLNVAAEGGTYTAELKSNGDWSIGATAEWVTVSPTSGNGDATLTFEVRPNFTGLVRNQEIIATTKDNTSSMTISQEAGDDPVPEPYITLAPNSMLGDWEGGTVQVIIQSNIAWTVTNVPEWMHCSAMEGEGNDTLLMTMNAFLEPGNREAYITFGDGSTSAQFHVRQAGTIEVIHFFNVLPNELQVPYLGDTKTLSVTCDETWVAMVDVDWAVLDQTEGEGNTAVVLTVAENPLYVERQGFIKFINASNNTVMVTINQDAAPDPHFLEVTPTNLNFGHEGGSQQVSIACDEDWIVRVSGEWISVSTEEGTGNGSLTVVAAQNTFNEPREAEITVISGNLLSRVVVMQEPGEEPLWANVTPDTIFVAQTGGVKSFDITSNIDWVLSAPSWITIPFTSSGSGNATVEMMVGANSAYSSRIGYIYVMRNDVEMARVVVVQEGVAPVLAADVEEIIFTREGGAQNFNLMSNISWTISSTADWLSYEPLGGAGNAEVLVKAEPLGGTLEREAVLVIRGMSQVVNIIVRQTN